SYHFFAFISNRDIASHFSFITPFRFKPGVRFFYKSFNRSYLYNFYLYLHIPARYTNNSIRYRNSSIQNKKGVAESKNFSETPFIYLFLHYDGFSIDIGQPTKKLKIQWQ